MRHNLVGTVWDSRDELKELYSAICDICFVFRKGLGIFLFNVGEGVPPFSV